MSSGRQIQCTLLSGHVKPTGLRRESLCIHSPVSNTDISCCPSLGRTLTYREHIVQVFRSFRVDDSIGITCNDNDGADVLSYQL